MSELRVTVDNRVRLCSAVLAASRWPARAQAEEAHAVHQQAKLTAQYVGDYADHPAVAIVDAHLEGGGSVTDLFAAALACRWPTFVPEAPLPPALAGSGWPEALSAFYTDTAIAAFLWADHEAVWQQAERQLAQIITPAGLPAFMARLKGEALLSDIQVVPNLVYPALVSLAIGLPTGVTLVLPPPKAWGESPPWSYAEGADWVLAVCCRALAPALLPEIFDSLPASGQARLRQAATVLFLESAIDEGAAQAYLVRTRKAQALPDLPAAVASLRTYLKQPAGADLVAHFS